MTAIESCESETSDSFRLTGEEALQPTSCVLFPDETFSKRN